MSVYPLLTCAIARSTKVLGDRWSLLILRDIILHKKSRFKEFRSSKEKIATNILSNRLKSLMDAGLIEKLDPLGSKKSTRYIATKRGIQALPIIIEMYLFSIHTISEAILNESQLNIKRQVLEDRVLFQENTTKEYGAFIKALITQKDA
ncbi:MAG: DNA-binding HxlR family transcriptional regulator [Patiriisocius sp.]